MHSPSSLVVSSKYFVLFCNKYTQEAFAFENLLLLCLWILDLYSTQNK